jgi:predicted metal-dependent peptidase
MTQEDCAACVRHAENLQEEDLEKEIRWDKILEPTVIDLQESDEDEESDKDNSVITGAEGRYDNSNNDAVPLD